jgi:hypothetical protein
MTVTDRTTARRPASVWVAIVGAAGVAVTASVALFLLGAPTDRGILRIAAYAAGYLLVGAVALLRRPDNRIGLILLAIAIAGSLTFINRFPDPAHSHAAS